MWTLVHLVKKTTPLPNTQRVEAFADGEFDLYLVPVNIGDSTAALLLKNNNCLPGNTMLMWYADYMAPMLIDGVVQILNLRRQQKSAVAGLAADLRDLLSTRDPAKTN